MNHSAPFYELPHGKPHEHSTIWAAAVAILFALFAAFSFAVDQSVSLSSLPLPTPHAGGR